jgi:hypothetical protein
MHEEIREYGRELEELNAEIDAQESITREARVEWSKLQQQYKRARAIWKEYEESTGANNDELHLRALGAVAALRDAYHRALAYL